VSNEDIRINCDSQTKKPSEMMAFFWLPKVVYSRTNFGMNWGFMRHWTIWLFKWCIIVELYWF